MADHKLSRTARLIAGNLPLHQTGTIVPRGYCIPVDTALSGVARFARRLGGTFPVLTPRNTMLLARDGKQSDEVIYVASLLTEDIPVGSIVSFQGLERHFVVDVTSNSGGSGSIFVASGGLLGNHRAGDPVYLHGYPVTVTAGVAAAASSIEVASGVKLVLGDVVEILTDPLQPGSAVEHTVTGFSATGGEEQAPFTYTISISPVTVRALAEDDTAYLRAYPAFISEVIPLPTQPSVFGSNIGPFLWDVMENRMHEGVPDVAAVLAVETISSAFEVIDSMAITAKNSPHWRVPIESSMFLFFDVQQGTLEVGTAKFTVGVPNAAGDFLITRTVRPAIEGVTWRATFEALSGDAELLIGFHLRDVPATAPTAPTGYTYNAALRMYYRVVALVAGILQVVEITSPGGYPCDRLEIGAFLDPGAVPRATGVVLRDWSQAAGRSSWVRYTLVAPVNGDYTWGSTGLLIKPMFFSADHVRLVQRLNSGTVMV